MVQDDVLWGIHMTINSRCGANGVASLRQGDVCRTTRQRTGLHWRILIKILRRSIVQASDDFVGRSK